MKIGIDFGTTNTAVSLFYEGKPSPFSFGATQERTPYVPSLFGLNRKGEERYGNASRKLLTMDSWRIFRNFKMLLSETPETCEAWGYTKEITPEVAAEKFLRHLLHQVLKEDEEPSSLVITVPHIWTTRPHLQPKRERIISILGGILPVKTRIQVEEEPIAAATYYLFAFEEEHRRSFEGHLLVCDCGGGTMDFCLVRSEAPFGEAKRNRLAILCSSGEGQIQRGLGASGVAYDEAVVRHLFPEEAKSNPLRWMKLLRSFEESKIALWETNDFREKVDECLNEKEWLYGTKIFHENLLDENLLDDPLFTLENQPVTLRLMVETFKETIVPCLVSSLGRLSKEAASRKMDLHQAQAETFRILFVGGFSQFYLTEKTVRVFFGSHTDKDRRFVKPKEYYGVLSISNGAALIAGEQVEVQKECPAEVGVYGEYYWGREAFPLLSKGTPIRPSEKPNFCKQRFRIQWNNTFQFTFYIKMDNIQDIHLSGEEIVKNVFDSLRKDRGESLSVYVGLSIDRDLRFFVHFCEDLEGDEAVKHPLGHLISLTQREASS